MLNEYKQSNRILGKDSDELEGYRWPLDGRHYGAGTRPSGIGRAAELDGPLNQTVRSPWETRAKAAPICCSSANPRTPA